jgi:hypothetical protein
MAILRHGTQQMCYPQDGRQCVSVVASSVVLTQCVVRSEGRGRTTLPRFLLVVLDVVCYIYCQYDPRNITLTKFIESIEYFVP